MFNVLDFVALTHDVPIAGLSCGNLGAVVEILAANALEVDFVAASGRNGNDCAYRDDDAYRGVATCIPASTKMVSPVTMLAPSISHTMVSAMSSGAQVLFSGATAR